MTWYATLDRIQEILDAETAEAMAGHWRRFRSDVEAAAEPPYHLRNVVATLERHRGTRPRGSIRILDHGCGPGSTLIWLAAFGYTDVGGVDVGGDFERQNRWAQDVLGHAEPRFTVYDGLHLPVGDARVDAILSQQVLEHVPDEQLEAYYAEEGRVLVPGGVALHQVPHRLRPYDSHSRTWLLPMLPVPVARWTMRRFGREWPDHLHLRWPWVHRRLLARHIGGFRNLSLERLRTSPMPDHYDGAAGVRRILTRLCTAPVVGPAVARAAATMVLMETVATRDADTRPSGSGG